MNDVVLNLDDNDKPPLPPARFHALSVQAVIRLGSELFSEQPQLQRTDPERACRLAQLVLAKAPEVNAALFVAPSANCPPEQVANRFANLSIQVVADLYSRQQRGELDAAAADREVWRRMAA